MEKFELGIRDGNKFGSGIRDGKNSNSGWKKFGSGIEKIRIRDPGKTFRIRYTEKNPVYLLRQWRRGGEFPGESGSGAVPGRVPQHPAAAPCQPSHGRRDPCVGSHHPQLLDDQHLLHALDDPSQVP
jgi:hypothetical protein